MTPTTNKGSEEDISRAIEKMCVDVIFRRQTTNYVYEETIHNTSKIK